MPLLAIIIDTPFTPDYTRAESPDLEEHGAAGLSLAPPTCQLSFPDRSACRFMVGLGG